MLCLLIVDVQVSFIPASYMVSEGGARNLTVVLSAIAETPVELLLSTSGISASGIELYTHANLSQSQCICIAHHHSLGYHTGHSIALSPGYPSSADA